MLAFGGDRCSLGTSSSFVRNTCCDFLKSESPIFMKFGRDVQHLCQISMLTFIRVGAQSTIWGTKFLPEKICIKNQQSVPEIYMILGRKIIKIPEFYYICPKNWQNSRSLHDFCPKMPEFYIIIARKIFFPNFRGACPSAPVSYAYANFREVKVKVQGQNRRIESFHLFRPWFKISSPNFAIKQKQFWHEKWL